MKILREPLLHFFLIGATIYGAYGMFGAPIEQCSIGSDSIDTACVGWVSEA